MKTTTISAVLTLSILFAGCGKISSAAPVDPFLAANGIHIRNNHGSGDIVPLRGVNLGAWLLMEGWQCPMDSSGLPDNYSVIQTLDNRFGEATEQNLLRTYQATWIQTGDLYYIQAMGMNVIRLPVWWANFQTLSGAWRTDAFDRVDWVVTNAWQRGIYTIIDLHGVPGSQSADQTTGRANQNQFWTNSNCQAQTTVLWQTIAAHFAGNPAVAGYDLMNEPMGAPNRSAVWSAYDTLYRAIRVVDPDHIIIMEGTYGSWNWSMLPNPATYGWTNVVYEMHEYQWGSTSNPSGVMAGIDNQVNDFRNHHSWNVPAYIGEFNAFGTGTATWKYAAQRFNTDDMSWSVWSYKAIHGAPPDSWGLFDPIGTWPAKPNIQTDSANTISNTWSAWGTSPAFGLNSMLRAALGSPLAVPDQYSATYGTTLTISSASAVLGNDWDINLGQPGIQLAAGWMDGPVHGQLTLNSDGSFIYTPSSLFVGTDSFRYSVFDGFAHSANIATASIQVAPPPLRWLVSNGQLLLSWPLGWSLQAQTNSVGRGLGTNWVTVPDSHLTNQLALRIWPSNGSVFLSVTLP